MQVHIVAVQVVACDTGYRGTVTATCGSNGAYTYAGTCTQVTGLHHQQQPTTAAQIQTLIFCLPLLSYHIQVTCPATAVSGIIGATLTVPATTSNSAASTDAATYQRVGLRMHHPPPQTACSTTVVYQAHGCVLHSPPMQTVACDPGFSNTVTATCGSNGAFTFSGACTPVRLKM
jgi:hypothetical protein